MDEIRKTIERLSNDANKGCGQCYELYAMRFSEAVDRVFPASSPDHEAAMAMVRAGGVYMTFEERVRERESWTNEGLCDHGLDPYVCPAGCGDLSG